MAVNWRSFGVWFRGDFRNRKLHWVGRADVAGASSAFMVVLLVVLEAVKAEHGELDGFLELSVISFLVWNFKLCFLVHFAHSLYAFCGFSSFNLLVREEYSVSWLKCREGKI